MSYITRTLLDGEQITHRAHLSRTLFVPPVLILAAAAGLPVVVGGTLGMAVLLGAFGLAYGLKAWVRYTTSEFAVTNLRVICKTGLIRRRVVDLVLNRVESVAVDQSVVERLFNLGSIVVTGTGGTKDAFAGIAAPLAFRLAVQQQLLRH